MADDWYYAQNNEQKGPVQGQELLALEKAGLLLPNSLVWRTGLANWQPWSSVAADVRSQAGAQPSAGGEVAVCAYSGQALPVSQMVKYGDHYVAAEHKDAFVESLREGGRVQAMRGSAPLQPIGFWWRLLGIIVDGVVLMVPNMLLMAPYMYFSIQDSMKQVRQGPPANPFEQFQNANPAIIFSYVLGMLGTFVVMMIYETWMVGRYGGTVGKLALGFKVLKVNGEPPTYGRAFGRWAAKQLTNVIWWVPAYGAIGLGILAQMAESRSGANDVSVALIVSIVFGLVWMVVGGFGYYMAGWTKKKQALHDKICGTLVVRKRPL